MRIPTYGDRKWGDCSMGQMEPSVDIIWSLGCVESKRRVVRRQENFRHQAVREESEGPDTLQSLDQAKQNSNS